MLWSQVTSNADKESKRLRPCDVSVIEVQSLKGCLAECVLFKRHMLVSGSAVDRKLQTETGGRGQKKSGSTFSERYGSCYQQFQPLFTLVGKPIHLQQRSSFVSPSQETISQLKTQNKTYSCFIADGLVENKTKPNTVSKIISGGVRRASVHRRQEQKPSTEVVYQKKTKLKNRSVVTRQPLVMCTMNLPGNRVPYEEASQMFSSTEEAKAMLKRLLASTNHESMMVEPVSTDDATQSQESQSRLLEKSEYLEDTYDYLFQRHVQTLNSVIRQQKQEETDEAHRIYNQKHCKQVIQLCCGDGGKCDDTSVIIGSTKSSRCNCSTISHHSSSCDRVTGSNNQNRNNLFASPISCSGDDEMSKDHSKKSELSVVNDNNQIGNSQCIQKGETTHKNISGDCNININEVTSKINALELQEVKVPPKPIITFNHVSTVSEGSSTSTESESINLKQIKTTSISSTYRSRSSSPLLEVPLPLEDLTTEMMRPPIK